MPHPYLQLSLKEQAYLHSLCVGMSLHCMAITFDSEQAKDQHESSRTRLQLSYERPLINPLLHCHSLKILTSSIYTISCSIYVHIMHMSTSIDIYMLNLQTWAPQPAWAHKLAIEQHCNKQCKFARTTYVPTAFYALIAWLVRIMCIYKLAGIVAAISLVLLYNCSDVSKWAQDMWLQARCICAIGTLTQASPWPCSLH